jgi:deoxyribonuclease-4
MLFGAHVSVAGGISKAIDRVEEIGGNAVQVFTQSPRMWKPTEHAKEELARFRRRRREARVKAVSCHAVYLVNLASRDVTVRESSLAALRATMETARAIRSEAVVFHVGSHLGLGFDDAVELVEPALRELLELTTDELWLCMENAAGAGGTIGRSIEELAVLTDAVDRHPRLGLCLDSCHWWASGVDVSETGALDDALDDLDARIGLDRVRVLHVNDSQTALASNRDRHDIVGSGVIADGLATFLGHPAFKSLPAITETWEDKGEETEDLDRMRDLRRRGVRRWAAYRRRGRTAEKTTPAEAAALGIFPRPEGSRERTSGLADN